MLDDKQHAELRTLLRRAIEGVGWDQKQWALEDAAKIVGVTFRRHFVTSAGLKSARAEHANS